MTKVSSNRCTLSPPRPGSERCACAREPSERYSCACELRTALRAASDHIVVHPGVLNILEKHLSHLHLYSTNSHHVHAIQGYLAHEKTPTPPEPPRTLGIGLR